MPNPAVHPAENLSPIITLLPTIHTTHIPPNGENCVLQKQCLARGGWPRIWGQTLAHYCANCRTVLCYNSSPCRPVYHPPQNVLFAENNVICHAPPSRVWLETYFQNNAIKRRSEVYLCVKKAWSGGPKNPLSRIWDILQSSAFLILHSFSLPNILSLISSIHNPHSISLILKYSFQVSF